MHRRSSSAHAESESEQTASDQSYETTTATTLSEEQSTPGSSDLSQGDQALACTECDLTFRTSGQRKEHENRKHIRRFKCDMCDRSFNLHADLRRHERTVHKVSDSATTAGHEEEGVLKCPNEGCKTANKVWDRKDNLARHTLRCKKALARSSVASKR
jgi:uncharacterized Zn-finger protein